MDFVKLSGLIEYANAHHFAISHQQFGGELEFAKGDGLDCAGLQVQGAADLAAGRVAVSVQDAAAAMRALARECDLRTGAIEFRAPLDQLFDARRTFFHQDARGFLVAKAVAGLQRVFEMQPNFVVVAECRCDTTLRVLGVRLRDLALGEAKHATRGGKFHRRAQAGDTRANNDEIGFGRKSWHYRIHGSTQLRHADAT